MLKNTMLVSLFMVSVSAFSQSPLAECATDDGTFKINDRGNGQVSINENTTSIVTIKSETRRDGSQLFSLITAAGNHIQIKQDDEGAFSYLDRGATGGRCTIGGGVNSDSWNRLAKQSKKVSEQSWILAKCARPAPQDALDFVVTYRKGLVSGQVILEDTRADTEKYPHTFSYVAKSVSSEGGLGHIQNYFIGEGHFSFFGLGHHVQQLPKTLVLDYNSRNGSQDTQHPMGSFSTGIEVLDKSVSSCRISNLWHINSLLNPE